MLLLWSLIACGPAGDTKFPPIVYGEPDTGAPEDSVGDSDPSDDTGEVVGDDSGEDTGSPTRAGQVCYPGEAEDWATCLDVVDWSASWGSDYDYPEPYNGSAQYAAPVRFIDLSAADPNLRLAPNFVLDEFMQEWKGRWGLFQPDTVAHLQAIRDNIGGPVTVNSGYRSPAYNASVGGVSSSRHQYGDAADLATGQVSLSELGSICALEGADYVGYYESHVHCDWRSDPLEEAFYDVGRAARRVQLPALDAALVREGPHLRAPATGWDEGEPLRIWRAWDADGALIVEQTSRAFTLPAGAARVEVEVGYALTRTLTLVDPD